MKQLNQKCPPWILGALLMNNNVSQEIVEELATHHNPAIRSYALAHEYCSIETQVADALLKESWT